MCGGGGAGEEICVFGPLFLIVFEIHPCLVLYIVIIHSFSSVCITPLCEYIHILSILLLMDIWLFLALGYCE